MADVNKPKIQLRSGLSVNGDKSPSPATKLLINHGKPNFTIQRLHKTQNGNANVIAPKPAIAGNFHNSNNNNEFVVKSTTFNGVFKPSNISAAAKQVLPQNGNTVNRNGSSDNEAAKVVLRRPKVAQVELRERDDDENVPEFIRRQRRIQERLANQNILDFENRRSGYFTQVMISPSSPSRQSFVETMASPAVKPGLEMPPPAAPHGGSEVTTKEQEGEKQQQEDHQETNTGNREETASLEQLSLNGQVEEEEVAKAIEEVNKAVAGEDDDKTDLEEYHNKDSLPEMEETEYAAAAATAFNAEEEENPTPKTEQQIEEKLEAENPTIEPEAACNLSNAEEAASQEKSTTESTNDSASVTENKVEQPKTNGHMQENHHDKVNLKAEDGGAGVTICHVNGINGPSIPTPDPSGEKGVNYETKTVVSFAQELGNGDNKYPDTVKVVMGSEVPTEGSELKELTKLKFEIKADDQDIEVTPVLVNEAA